MNNWNFNELTQEDQFDFKACQRKDKTIYGVPDKSECVQGKEISSEDLNKLARAANKGDKQAKAQLDQYKKVTAEQTTKEKAENKKQKEAEAKKKAEAGGKGKKGKGGKGKKGGGKGKKGAEKGGSGSKLSSGQMQANAKKAQAQASQRRQARAKEIRSRISELQKTLRSIKNPDVRNALEQQISDALKSVSQLSQGATPSGDAPKPSTPSAPETSKEPWG